MTHHDDLGQFAREHHVHYDVQPNALTTGHGHEVVGFDVRLFATHPASKLKVPACPTCVEVASELRSFAERVAAAGDAESWTEVAPVEPVLYESTEDRGTDEVAVTLRIRLDSPRDQAAASDDRRLGEIKKHLDELGVPQR